MTTLKEGILKFGDSFYNENGFQWWKIILAFLVCFLIALLQGFTECSSSSAECFKQLSDSGFKGLFVVSALILYILISMFVLYFLAKKTKWDMKLMFLIFTILPSVLFIFRIAEINSGFKLVGWSAFIIMMVIFSFIYGILTIRERDVSKRTK